MRLKDYYEILGLPPDASVADIKKSYRRLAMQYHPDKNSEDKIAAAHFKGIKEAYETLIHPEKREAYHQQRWYNQAVGRRFAQSIPLTPYSFLEECLFLDQYVSTLDKFRIDHEGLFLYITDLLSNETLDSLREFNDPHTMRQIVYSLLSAANTLPYKQAASVGERLLLLAPNDQEVLSRIAAYVSRQRKAFQSERYKIIIILFVVLVICVVIYMTGKRD